MKRKISLFTLILAVFSLGGCEPSNEYVAPPPPAVTVALPQVQEITDYLEFTGTTDAAEQVEVRARVSGILESMNFEPSSYVNQGDVLFVIHPAEYEADLQAAKAELAAAEAQHNRAKIEYGRARTLFKDEAGAESDVVKWRVERDIAAAQILRAKARVEHAQLDLGYTQVIAQISGRVGRNLVDIGNLVGEGEPTKLTNITHFDPMYVYFNLNERDLLRVMKLYRARLKEKGIDPDELSKIRQALPISMGLANEEGFPHQGMYDFSESGVDPETGTIQLRGVFENRGKPPVLMPGLFARIRMPVGTRDNMPLVTERAIAADQSGRFVLIVNSENIVEKRNIRQGRSVDGLRVIEEGIGKEDRIIVSGLQRARPGAPVTPELVDMNTQTSTALAAAAKASAQPAPLKEAEAAED